MCTYTVYNVYVFTFGELYIHILMPFKCIFFMSIRVVNWSQRQEQLRNIV